MIGFLLFARPETIDRSFAFIRLHRWIKLCKTVNKIIFFLLYVTKDRIHTKCTDTKDK